MKVDEGFGDDPTHYSYVWIMCQEISPHMSFTHAEALTWKPYSLLVSHMREF
jgi:hypothetical protein